jgi:hypothetical protein
MRRVLASLVILPVMLGAAGCTGEGHVSPKRLKEALDKTSTQVEFIRVAESFGLDCRPSTIAVALCLLYLPEEGLNTGPACLPVLRATAGFVDGRREAGDYEVVLATC